MQDFQVEEILSNDEILDSGLLLDILHDGSREDILKLHGLKFGFCFFNENEMSYELRYGNEMIRGYGFPEIPNCVRFFGTEFIIP